MKNAWIVLLVMGISISVNAQQNPHRGDVLKDLSVEEIATLKSKRLALALSLDTSQQKSVYNLELQRANQRKAATTEREEMRDRETKLSKEERFALKNAQLDRKIAFQRSMKDILTEEQFEQWKRMHHKKSRGHHSRKRSNDRRSR